MEEPIKQSISTAPTETPAVVLTNRSVGLVLTRLLFQRFWYLAITLAILLADQVTKAWAWMILRLMPSQQITLIEGMLNLDYAENPGIAFSLLGSWPPATRWFLFAVASLAAIGVFFYLLFTPLRERRLLVALSMILGGIIGNAIDRVVHGFVVDFLDVYIRWQGEHHWPTFNVADSFICIGAFLLAVDLLVGSQHASSSPSHSPRIEV